MNKLIEIDQAWLVAINGCHAEWADGLMWVVSGKWTWLPLYALLIGLLVWRFGWKRGLVMLVGFAAAVGLADFVSSGIIKPWVCRLRPTHEPAIMDMLHIVRDYRGGMYGFVSSHAANTMACGLLFCLIWNQKDGSEKPSYRWSWLLMIWVAMNCYSRMYLGVHYLGDILGGLLVGSLIAWPVFVGLKKVLQIPCLACAASVPQTIVDDEDRGCVADS